VLDEVGRQQFVCHLEPATVDDLLVEALDKGAVIGLDHAWSVAGGLEWARRRLESAG